MLENERRTEQRSNFLTGVCSLYVSTYYVGNESSHASVITLLCSMVSIHFFSPTESSYQLGNECFIPEEERE